MEYNDFKDTFSEILPILFKASPIIAGFIGSPATGVILALLAALVGANPCQHCEMAEKLKSDPDLYAKLQNLESTHADWLKKFS
jgi:hypothetical protein